MFRLTREKSRQERWASFESEALPHQVDLYRLAKWLLRDRDEAEDLVQETFVGALRSFHRFEKGTNCRAWLIKIMYHTLSKHRRSLSRLHLVEADDLIAQTVAFQPSPPQGITDQELLAALKRLPRHYQEVVILSDVEDMSYKEIADALSVPTGTVMSRLHRARRLLRVELASYASERGIGAATDGGETKLRLREVVEGGNQMQCHDFREIADSYLSDELLIETNHDVIRHLESCAECRFELAARRQWRYQLRTGFQEAPDLQMREEFSRSLKNHLRDRAFGRPHRPILMKGVYVGLAAAIVVAMVVGFVAFQRWRGHDRDALAQAELIQDATGIHRECALEHKLGATILDLNEAGRTYDRAYSNLANPITPETLPAGAQLLEAHSCMFQGRRFAHLVMKYRGEIVSVLVTNADGQGAAISSLQSDNYRLVQFETSRHAVFVVSALAESDNMALARTIAPSIEDHIKRAEQS